MTGRREGAAVYRFIWTGRGDECAAASEIVSVKYANLGVGCFRSQGAAFTPGAGVRRVRVPRLTATLLAEIHAIHQAYRPAPMLVHA